MDTVIRTEFFAKPEVQAALATVKEAACQALPATGFAQRESAILALFGEAGRSLLEEDLQALSDGFAERLLVGGVEYKKHEPGVIQYHSLGGPIHVRRFRYRRAGVHNGPTVVPLERLRRCPVTGPA